MKRLFTLFFSLLLFYSAQAQNLTFVNEGDIHDLVNVDQYVWAATSGGLVKFDTIAKTKTYFNTENSGLPINNVQQLALDGSSNLWMVCEGNAIARFDGSSFTVFDIRAQFSIPSNCYLSDIIYYNNKIHVSFSTDKIFAFDGSTWSQISINFTGEKSDSRVIRMKTYQNYLYLSFECYEGSSSYSDYVRYDGMTFTLIKSFLRVSSQPASNQNATTVFEVDANGNIWLAQFEGGLIMIDIVTFNVTTFVVPGGIRNCPNLYIHVIVITHNVIYCGGAGKNGVMMYDITNGTWSTVNTSNSAMSYSDVNAILFCSANSLFVGNGQHFIHVALPSYSISLYNFARGPYNMNTYHTLSFVGDSVFVGGSVCTGENDSLKYYNTQSNTWTTYSTYGGFSMLPRQVIKDNQGLLWMGNRLGLYYFNVSNQTWVQYTLNGVGSLADVMHICVDNLDNKWLQLGNGSVVKITAAGDMSTITTNATYWGNIYFDGQNSVYVSGDGTQGVLKIDINTNAISSLSTDNYGRSFTLCNILFANDTLYVYDGNVVAKIKNGQLIRKFEISDFVTHHTINAPFPYGCRTIAVDKEGNFYFANTNANKLYVYNSTTGFSYLDYTNSSLSYIMDVFIDDRNDIWVFGDGLYRIDQEDVVTSITQRNEDHLSLQFYPNPVQDQGTLALPYSADLVQSITVYNTQSTVVKDLFGTVSADPNQLSISVSDLPKGIYVVKVKFSNDAYGVSKFVKM